ncbi:MJ1255/VC2487 family glycosyltransferase [Gayadomonas joobiniege]|uniref:MJ1255/VC2487 family glycosyltransferase n=1 Tax=Gayadomonas joobiniege TaxID=1234606 RepID=UPI0003782F64|nr:MJ1255/VC2487 family glycosyltransferase [Gayadomonas joobiniege]
MKILYGVQGTGNGHISRARIMAKRFNELGIQVDYLFSGRPANKFFDMQVFGNYQVRQGMSFTHKDGGIDLLTTLQNIKPLQFWRDVKALDLSNYDVVLNDFEPISAWAARRQGIASINISHQAAFLQPVPMQGAGWTDKKILRYFAPCQYNLGVHWYHFGANIIPPFIDEPDTLDNKDNKILVYLPFESLPNITAMLADFCDYEFYCYHPSLDADSEQEHIKLRKLSRTGFKHDLAECKGIIANAGFELSSEALCYGKRILLKPLTGQFEQESNAKTLELLGLATVMPQLNFETVEQWLEHKNGGRVKFPSDPQPLIDWVMKGEYNQTRSLLDQLWSQVEFPKKVSHKLKQDAA